MEAAHQMVVPADGRRSQGVMLPYVEAIGVVTACTLVRALADPVLGDAQQFMPFAFAVVLVSLRGRVWPAVLALVTSFLSSWYCFSPPRGTMPGRYGIAGMVERVRIAGGGCTITSAAGKGTTVSATLPVADSVRTGTPPRR